jgi:hypothetical protein
MVGEILDRLAPRSGESALDATLGYGGHARELMARLRPGGHLVGLDVDPLELPRTVARLREEGDVDGSTGIGSGAHLLTEMLKLATGIEAVHVPYKGGGPATNDLIAGQITVGVINAPPVLPYITAG